MPSLRAPSGTGSWSPPFPSLAEQLKKVLWKHEGSSCGNDPVSDSASDEAELVFAVVSLTPRALSEGRACQQAGKRWAAQCGGHGCPR